MNVDDHRSFLALLKQQRERPERGLNFLGLSPYCLSRQLKKTVIIIYINHFHHITYPYSRYKVESWLIIL